MLSRIAESLYWVGRYNERSEAAARILDVYAHSLLEDRLGDEEAACARLLDALGVGEMAPEIGADVDELISFVIDDPRYDGSIVGSLQAAWENARGAREAISSEMWETVNTTHSSLAARRGMSTFAQHSLLGWVRDRAAIVSGLADATMSHDDAWRFLVLGRTLERVDMTVRLVSTRLGDAWGPEGWVAMLRCCSAYESYLRTYRRGISGRRALEFLMLDRLFPRSVFHALALAEQVLVDLDPGASRRVTGSEARRVIGSACAELEFVRADELEIELPAYLDRLESSLAQAHEAVATQFFHAATAIRWSA
jgi:uncharacterized alpha-E superfamily protein